MALKLLSWGFASYVNIIHEYNAYYNTQLDDLLSTTDSVASGIQTHNNLGQDTRQILENHKHMT